MEPVDVKFGEWIERGFGLYRENFGILVLASLIAVVISAITGGILAGPMAAGIILIVFRIYDQKENQPEVGTLFRCAFWQWPTGISSRTYRLNQRMPDFFRVWNQQIL